MDSGMRRLSSQRTEQYFHGDHLELVGNRYVSWVDIMGVKDALESNQKAPAIWRGELLSTVHEYIDESKVEVFTVGDGVVIMTDYEDYLDSFLAHLFEYYVNFNIRHYDRGDWDTYLHRLLRAGVGAGRVYRIDIESYDRDKDEGSPFPEDFANTPFGPGPIEAFDVEGGAPFSIHEATALSSEPVKWWQEVGLSDQKRYRLLELLADYFAWFDERDYYRYDPYDAGHDEAALDFFDGHGFDIDMRPD